MPKEFEIHHSRYGEPDGDLILAAASGDKESIMKILDFYEGYISAMAIVRYRNQNDAEIIFYDEDLHKEILCKVIKATLKFDITR